MPCGIESCAVFLKSFGLKTYLLKSLEPRNRSTRFPMIQTLHRVPGLTLPPGDAKLLFFHHYSQLVLGLLKKKVVHKQ